MADDINKKISIDVEINTDGQQQIQQYKTTFDNLRDSINNLANPIKDLSGSSIMKKSPTMNKKYPMLIYSA